MKDQFSLGSGESRFEQGIWAGLSQRGCDGGGWFSGSDSVVEPLEELEFGGSLCRRGHLELGWGRGGLLPLFEGGEMGEVGRRQFESLCGRSGW